MRQAMKLVACAIITVSACVAFVRSAAALPITFSGTNDSNLSASATFDISGSTLQVTLRNTSASDALVPADVLTAVFFSLAGNPALMPASATIPAGSSLLFSQNGPGVTNVGGAWFHQTGLSGLGGATQGISTVGFGFSQSNLFNGSPLNGGPGNNQLAFGLVSTGDDPGTGNMPVTGSRPLIKDSVVFALSGLPSGFQLSDVSNVRFQYGTSLTEPSFSGSSQVPEVPEPATLLLVGSGVAAATLLRRRRRG